MYMRERTGTLLSSGPTGNFHPAGSLSKSSIHHKHIRPKKLRFTLKVKNNFGTFVTKMTKKELNHHIILSTRILSMKKSQVCFVF